MLEEIREVLNSPHQVVDLVSGPPALENLTQNGIFGFLVLPCLSFPCDYIDVFSAIKKKLLSCGLGLAGIRNHLFGNCCLTLSRNTACLS